MKKTISLLLIAAMVCSMGVSAFATNDYTSGTQVTFEAQGSESYTVTVPALMNPGDEGTVTLSGTWASNRRVTVTAEETVTLANSINANDTKVLDITFAGIAKNGDNTESKTYTETVAVAAMPADALFGTWSGVFEYQVGIQDAVALEGDGQTFHKMAPSTLSFRSTEPLNEFQEVRVNGEVVDPSNYTLTEGSTIVTLSIDYLKTLEVQNYQITVVSENDAPVGGFEVVTSDSSECGFYYNQPYTSNQISEYGNMVVILYKNNTLDIYFPVYDVTETCSYVCDNNTIVFTSEVFGDVVAEINSNGEINAGGMIFALSDDWVADRDYVYWYDKSMNGYHVRPLDKTKVSYNPIRTGINGIDTVQIGDLAFSFSGADAPGNVNMIFAPEIPNTVTHIGRAAFQGCTNLKAVNLHEGLIIIGQCAFMNCAALPEVSIPQSVTTLEGNAFASCKSLKNVTFAKNSQLTKIEYQAFDNCTSLTNISIPKSVTSIGFAAFRRCSSLTNILFEGTVEQWNSIYLGEEWNKNVPATEVICSNGTVSLL